MIINVECRPEIELSLERQHGKNMLGVLFAMCRQLEGFRLIHIKIDYPSENDRVLFCRDYEDALAITLKADDVEMFSLTSLSEFYKTFDNQLDSAIDAYDGIIIEEFEEVLEDV